MVPKNEFIVGKIATKDQLHYDFRQRINEWESGILRYRKIFFCFAIADFFDKRPDCLE